MLSSSAWCGRLTKRESAQAEAEAEEAEEEDHALGQAPPCRQLYVSEVSADIACNNMPSKPKRCLVVASQRMPPLEGDPRPRRVTRQNRKKSRASVVHQQRRTRLTCRNPPDQGHPSVHGE